MRVVVCVGLQMKGIMKLGLISTFLILVLIACAKQEESESVMPSREAVSALVVPNLLVDISKLEYNKNISIWNFNGQAFSGYAVSYFQDSSLMQKFGIVDGRKQNEAKEWYADGHIKHAANYHKGKLHGEKKSWSAGPQHQLVSQLNYYLGKADGFQKKWYRTGEIFKILHYEMGKEKGIQQAFRKNGELFANYEAREGRTFGLKRSALCFGLEDESIQYEE